MKHDATGSGDYSGIPNQTTWSEQAKSKHITVITTVRCTGCHAPLEVEYVKEDGTLSSPSQQCGCGRSFDAQFVHGKNYDENA